MSHTGNIEGLVVVLFLSIKAVCTVKDCILLKEMKDKWARGSTFGILKSLYLPMFLNMLVTIFVYRSSITEREPVSVMNWARIGMLMFPRPIFWALVDHKHKKD